MPRPRRKGKKKMELLNEGEFKRMKSWAIGLGILAVIVSIIAGAFFGQVRQAVAEKKSVETKLAETVEKHKTELALRDEQIKQTQREAESFKRKTALIDSSTGRPALDGRGRPIYEYAEGMKERSDELEGRLLESQRREESLSDQLAVSQREKAELKASLSRPAISSWEFGARATAPLISIGDVSGYFFGADVSYHFRLFNLDVGTGGGPEIGPGPPRASLRLSGRP